MACYSLPLVRVWKDELGRIVIAISGRKEISVNPSLVWPDYNYGDINTEYDNSVTLYISGDQITKPLAPDLIRNQQGVKIGDIAAVKAYFDELGIGQEQGGGTVDLSNYYTKAQVDGLIAAQQVQIDYILEQIGIVKLVTPDISADTPTQTSVNITVGSVPNATSYQIFRNGVSVYTGASGVIPQTGLTPNTDYDFAVVASADGFAPSDAALLSVTTLPAQQTQLGTPVPVTSNITANSITISWPAVANTTTYEIRRNNVPLTAVQGLTYTDNGLSPSTQYQYIVIAKAAGYIDSAQGIVSGTTQAGGQTPVINLNSTTPLNENTLLSA